MSASSGRQAVQPGQVRWTVWDRSKVYLVLGILPEGVVLVLVTHRDALGAKTSRLLRVAFYYMFMMTDPIKR